MDLSHLPRRPAKESIVPMINVVFLLLIFFLMTAEISPPEPFDITPPDSAAETPAERRDTVFVSATGEVALGDLTGDAVFAHLADQGGELTLSVRADRAVEADKIAALLPRLAGAGVTHVKLISARK